VCSEYWFFGGSTTKLEASQRNIPEIPEGERKFRLKAKVFKRKGTYKN
jgi:hypothetical protein